MQITKRKLICLNKIEFRIGYKIKEKFQVKRGDLIE